MHNSFSSVALGAVLASASIALAANATFYPTINMTDTDGNLIQAHGGAILQSASSGDSNYYWFGEDKSGETNSGHFIGVNCYRSADFSSWEAVGHVLEPIAGTNISSDAVVERPKVIYNDKNDEYVMYFHADNSSYGAAMVGVATSKTIDGQYDFKDAFKPFGNDSRDMTIWKDPDDGSAYLIFATNNNADFEIASLTDDYYNVSEGLYTFSGVYWEAPGVFKIDGTFYLLYSRQDGWTPTDDYYMTATSMSGPWSEPTLLAPPEAYTYLTQNAYDITIKGSQSTLYLYYGDHWNADALGSSTYSFYPVTVSGAQLSLHKTGGWTMDAETGTWTDLPFEQITAADSSTSSDALVTCDDGCEGDKTANMTAANTFTFTWSGSAGDKVVGIEYTYTGPKNSFRHIGASVDGSTLEGNALLETSRVNNVTQEAPLPMKLATGSKVILSLLDYDGNDLLIDGVKIYDYIQ